MQTTRLDTSTSLPFPPTLHWIKTDAQNYATGKQTINWFNYINLKKFA